MIPALAALAVLAQTPDTVVSHVQAVIRAYADTSAARAAGFTPLGRGRLQDGTPFQGIHWVNARRFVLGGSDLDQPSFLMYAPTKNGLRLVGAAFSRRISHQDTVPSGIGGEPADWHLHQACLNIPGVGLALADGLDDCKARGGTPTPRETAMVHVWIADSPGGPFSHDNVDLPYQATGVRRPADEGRARALGVAIADSYGFRLSYVKRIDLMDTGARTDSITGTRAAIARLVEELRAAQGRNDQTSWDSVAAQVIAQGDRLRALYQRASPSPEFRAQLDHQYGVALGTIRHHEM